MDGFRDLFLAGSDLFLQGPDLRLPLENTGLRGVIARYLAALEEAIAVEQFAGQCGDGQLGMSTA